MRDFNERKRTRKRRFHALNVNFGEPFYKKTCHRPDTNKFLEVLRCSLDANLPLENRILYSKQALRLLMECSKSCLIRLLTNESDLMLNVADAILGTGCERLRQMNFMILSGTLCMFYEKVGEKEETLRSFRQKLSSPALIEFLPWKKGFDWSNPDTAQAKLNQINRQSMSLSRINVQKCWVSTSTKKCLRVMATNSFVNVGSDDVILSPEGDQTEHLIIPYTRIYAVEILEDECVVYIFTADMPDKRIIALLLLPESLSALRKVFTCNSIPLLEELRSSAPKESHSIRSEKQNHIPIPSSQDLKRNHQVKYVIPSEQNEATHPNEPIFENILGNIQKDFERRNERFKSIMTDQIDEIQYKIETASIKFEEIVTHVSRRILTRNTEIQAREEQLNSLRNNLQYFSAIDLPHAQATVGSIFVDANLDCSDRQEHLLKSHYADITQRKKRSLKIQLMGCLISLLLCVAVSYSYKTAKI